MIQLLPALPDAWQKGNVKGLKPQSPQLQKVYEYDIKTKAGRIYVIKTFKEKL